ncbi:YchF/TatD family DNA exonuclease [Aestuariibacter halophilus]|uniref:YchF/TatD family DNA exonuclease n=1 Tax=Fluctibacter halophilus TaxID=226011 RepID=A0ABS8G7J5_9ALTE|nr:YchF/TatD family DNA exonuclease [Aestuariibacter halophilus]MCC2615639.1 YchF/TatD family DNA exonuclease [Aestuariibacter halophilus]
MLVDSHCHLDRLDMDDETLAQTIAFARQRGVEHFLCVAVSVDSFTAMHDRVARFDDVSMSCGVHPLHQDEACDKQTLLEAARHPRVVAIGETGLDYHYSANTKSVQLTSFVDHIDVANTLSKPLIIHTREAKQDTLSLLKAHKADNTQGVLHCFTEDLDMATQAMDLGMYISISGIVTFHSADQLRDVVRHVPLDRLLVETDSPWLAPVPYRGKQNQPGYVREVAEYVADLKGVTLDALASATTDNFYRLFSLAGKA